MESPRDKSQRPWWFTDDLASCFELLPEECSVHFERNKERITCILNVPYDDEAYAPHNTMGQAGQGEEALALCLALERLMASGWKK